MSLDDTHIKIETLADEQLYIPDREGWRHLLQGESYAGKTAFPENIRQAVEYYLELTDKYHLFILSFHDIAVFSKYHSVCMLLRTDTGLQRVHIEHLKCDVCGCYGATANPMILDLYFGVADKWEVMRRAERHPVLPCPRCKSKLPRHPIWTEPLQRVD